MKKILFILILGFVAVSCDRDLEFDTISVTPPALEVQVEGPAVNNTYPKISGATVELFNSNNQSLATATTNSDGKVVFTKEQLKEKGVFRVTASKDGKVAEATTTYLLLNDGVTLLIISLQ